jgi:Zn-dependent protease with chaperone function
MSDTFNVPNALCFGQDLPAAGTACRVEVSSQGLALHLPHLAREDVGFHALSVQAGGFDLDQLVLKWALNGTNRVLYLKDPAVILAFRKAAPSSLSRELEGTAAEVRRATRSRRNVLLAGAASVLALIVAIWLGFDALVAVAVNRIPIEWERVIGESARDEFLAGRTIVKDGPAVAAVQEVTRRLTESVPQNPYQFEVTLVRSEIVNAFALPGGHVIVFTGLITEATGPEEMAGVLSHELSHVLLRHGLKRVVKNVGVVAVVTILVGGGHGTFGLAQRLATEMLTLKFSRQQETEADLAGLRLLRQARISASGLIQFFDRLSKSASQHAAVELLSTHPMSAARAERLKQEAAALPEEPPVPFSFDWPTVQAGATRSTK